jgi:protein-disulfide isomerase
MSLTFLSRLLLPTLLSVSLFVPAHAQSKPKPKPKVDPVLEQQILEVLRKNPEVLYQVLRKYAEEKRAEEERKEKADRLAAIQKFFQNSPAVIGSSPTTGATNNKLLLVKFADFQCSGCLQSNEAVKKFMAKHKDRVTLVFKNFPLTQRHPQALPAAKAAWAAHKQGKFWEYHDELFANQAKLSEAFYLETAQKLKLDLPKFRTDYEAADQAIVNDFTLGRRLDIEKPPALFLNGEQLTNTASLEELEKVLARIDKK